MRADRLLSVLLLLQSRRRVTGRQLAAHLEVSARTVHRDMDALSAAGIPVVAIRGAQGGWELSEGWRTEVPGLDDVELRALLMAQPRVIGDVPLAAAAERAMVKLLAAMPEAQRRRAATMRQRLFVDPVGWRGTRENLSMLPIVQAAVEHDRKLRIRYRSIGKEPEDRTVSPLGLVAKAMTWYLVAQADAGLRTYRVSRIEAAEPLDEPVSRPTDFDLAVYWKTSNERFASERRQYAVTLRLEPAAARRMLEFQNSVLVPEADAGDREGWVTLVTHFESEDEAAFFVGGLGARADVIEPASLRRRIVGEAAAIVARAMPT
jgi:predicted DNA-binding transcriptional regulator YafY